MNIGSKIKEIRESKGVTQTYILKIIGKSSGWLSQIESGDREIKVNDLSRVAKALETPIEQFFSA